MKLGHEAPPYHSGPRAWHDDAVLDVVFDLSLAHGRCVGLRLPSTEEEVHELAARALADEERAFALGLPGARRRTWVGGRAALRRALEVAGIEGAGCILADERGAPSLPRGISGSISHKETLAVALVATSAGHVGVDLELDRVGRVDIASHVLADDELAEVAALDQESRSREVLLRFSAKEAIYKALDPFVRRYVAFREVSVSPRADGTAEVRQHLSPGEGPFEVETTWRRTAGVVLTTARVTLRRA
jgi:4'-phosphopantetheinyl transferase EntD